MGKEKIAAAFKEVLDKGDKAFVPYIMAGDGGLEHLQEQILFLEKKRCYCSGAWNSFFRSGCRWSRYPGSWNKGFGERNDIGRSARKFTSLERRKIHPDCINDVF